ncbi:hypothetical protein [Cohnella hashimotonis]|uniref:DUF4229 domain-containing protein n=1 Tax=Cohnella hashimotonis TaxID=2826895 RepID=A0ABT6TKT7_9BACL|nr:hypothetical protein [Cohnella hashimotonis]MDI4647458.1 hypothetical protein [Cohnella hashimotonis]
MFEAFRRTLVVAILLMIAGIVFFLVGLLTSHEAAWVGLFGFTAGLGLLLLVEACKAELNRLRLENVELRRRLDAIEKRTIRD